MTSPTDDITKALGLLPDMSTKSGPGRKRTALQQALDELTSLPREEMLRRVDARQAGANLERFFACDKNTDCHNHSVEDVERVSRVVGEYRGFDAQRRPFTTPGDDASQLWDDGVNVIEVVGSVKWFDCAKGYGFIVRDDGGPDVLLHITCVRAGGYQTAYEGARIHCEVLVRSKGLQVFKIISMDETTAVHPSLLPQRTHVVVTPESDWEQAEVKWFNRVRGFGFLTLPNGSLAFLHMETLRRFGFAELRPGQMIEVRWGHGSKGLTAAELRVAKIPEIRKN